MLPPRSLISSDPEQLLAELRRLYNDLYELLYIEPWITVSNSQLLNSWQNYDEATYGKFSYRKYRDTLYMRGLLKGGSSGTSFFQFPVGYRPVYNQAFSVYTNGGYSGGVVVMPDGYAGIDYTVSSLSWLYICGSVPLDA